MNTLTILGIDPGSRATGYGVIELRGRELIYLASGCIRTPNRSHIERLDVIGQGIEQLMQEFTPQETAIEKVFVSKNADSALKLGQARAAAICAMLRAISHADIHEYAPRAIKQAAVGYGGADKEQVAHMIKRMLNIAGDLSADATDALAVAVCHANTRGLKARLAMAEARS